MSQQKKSIKPLALAIGATFVASMATTPMASAATANSNPFAMNDLQSGYTQLASASCGSNAKKMNDKGAAEANCSAKKGKSKTEANCGAKKAKKAAESSCGSNK